MKRLTIPLAQEESDALWGIAKRERRDPRAQAALLIRQALERAGLLPGPETITATNEGSSANVR